MGAARKALWYIESHFAENPSLAQIAEAVELSPFHLSRLFQVSTGTSMARYLRARRLTEAARTLAAGNVPILDVALAAGYAAKIRYSFMALILLTGTLWIALGCLGFAVVANAWRPVRHLCVFSAPIRQCYKCQARGCRYGQRYHVDTRVGPVAEPYVQPR